MAMDSDHPKYPRVQRNIVFFGETGTGKSSIINLLLKTGTPKFAQISNDSHPCTQSSACYETAFHGNKYNLWDTRGLGGARNLIQILFGGNSEKDLKKFLKERHYKREIDLLVCCIRGSRATEALRNYYEKFCVITRRLAAPVAVVVTQLEKEKVMEDWWSKNSPHLEKLGMEFDDHVCITALQGHPRLDESRMKLVEMIARNHRWEPRDGTGSYFGSPVRKLEPTTFEQPSRGGIWSRVLGTTGKNVDGKNLARRSSNHPPSAAPSIIGSGHLVAGSPAESMLPSPVVEPPTPRSSATTMTIPHINTNIVGADGRPQPPSEGSSSAEDSLQSMFHPKSSHSSCTAYSQTDVYLESCVEENEGPLVELPFRPSTATIRRKQTWASHSGAFGDVWECNLISGDSSRLVAVKAVKIDTSNGHDDLRAYEKKLRRELKIWGKLRHRNIAPLLGVVSGFGPLPSAVSPWFSNGSLTWYLAHCKVPKRTKHRLLGDIAVGLCYLHSQGVIHGDLHSGNVLIDDDGTACITDFGLSFISDFVGTSYLRSTICGGVQFADPALVRLAYTSQDNVFYPTKPCDIYSFGGLMLHVLSGNRPYAGIRSPTLVVTVMNGERPQIPTDITPWYKSLIRMCWDIEEHKRPTADALVKKFDRF